MFIGQFSIQLSSLFVLLTLFSSSSTLEHEYVLLLVLCTAVLVVLPSNNAVTSDFSSNETKAAVIVDSIFGAFFSLVLASVVSWMVVLELVGR